MGIGAPAPSEKLEVNGNIKIPAGNSYMGSDIRLKTDIDTIGHALDIVKQLNGVYYKWDTTVMLANGFNYNTGRQIGFIAQNVQTALPEIVSISTDSLGLLSLDYSRLSPVLVEALKELANSDSIQNVKIQTLKTNDSILIDSLQQNLVQVNTRINSQDSVITALQNQINSLALLINSCCNNNNNGHGNGHGHGNLSTSGQGDDRTITITKTTSVELNNKSIVVLDQNVPNPFVEQTTISYYLPDNVTKAQIIFYDQSSKVIKVIDLTEKGKGYLNVFANDLTNGIYTYSLVVDGAIIETKRMIKQ